MIIGLYPPEMGEVWFDGQRIDGLPPYRIVERGLAKTFQIPREFQRLTVLENLLVSSSMAGERLMDLLLSPRRVRHDLRENIRRAEEVLDTVGLLPLRDEYAGNLSGGQKKLLELARALVKDPKLIMLDEPVAGINPTLTNHLLKLIEDLRDDHGKTFFLVEHDMDVVMRHCDHIIVMHQGRRLTEGTPEEVKTNPEVIESYLGA
jgi:branched-chain amino acid transport system ATP-binding protein